MTVLAILTAAAAPASGQTRQTVELDTANQSLARALNELARRTGVEFFFAAPDLGARPAPRLKGRFTFEQALPRLLVGSNLAFRRTPDGVFVITAAAASEARDAPVALPELLVTGRRTQNTDIARSNNDIQPYQTWTARDIDQAHAADIQEFLHTRLTSNGQAVSPYQQLGVGRSEVDLRGLGAGQTLVLVDGRRMPAVPYLNASGDEDLLQADLNAVPLSAIARIEVLNSTAGGLYGASATAGAINIVLKRDYGGTDLTTTAGVSGRGDAPWARLDARAGWTSPDDATHAMVTVTLGRGSRLDAGDRDFARRARMLRAANNPVGFAQEIPVSGGFNIYSDNGPLVLKPAYGGAKLGAASTYIPFDYKGLAQGVQPLIDNAGKVDASLSSDAAGRGSNLLLRPTTTSLLANARHRFNPWLETYADLLVLEDSSQGRLSVAPHVENIWLTNALNPFQQQIRVSYAAPDFDSLYRAQLRTIRATLGAIVDLPRSWRGDIDFGFGGARLKTHLTGSTLSDDFIVAMYYGRPGADGEPVISPFLGGQAFERDLAAYKTPFDTAGTRRNRFGDLSVRLAGPVASLPGGPMTLSLLAEERRETTPASRLSKLDADGASFTTEPPLALRNRALYAELRAPLVDRALGPAALRGLELQLAVRRERTRTVVPADLTTYGQADEALITSRQGATVYTVGLRAFPLSGLMVRASSASGFLPPGISQIGYSTFGLTTDPTLLAGSPYPDTYLIATPPADPKRGGVAIGAETIVAITLGGSPNLRSERAHSDSAGLVITPPGLQRLRVSLDYTRIEKRREIVSLNYGDFRYFLQHEDQLPDQVVRAPLTDADRAKGYTGGLITMISTGGVNVGRTLVEAVDLQADYAVPTVRHGDFGLRLGGSWQPRLVRRFDPNAPAVDYAGRADGPLIWRASAGLDWTKGGLNMGLNAIYYDRYVVSSALDDTATAARKVLQQGSAYIPSQVYFDAYAHRVILINQAWGPRRLELRAGILNLLGHNPPTVANSLLAPYSTYGDPRLRRFELSLTASF